jgi:hypothetical protein
VPRPAARMTTVAMEAFKTLLASLWWAHPD